jgi:hypothetical protein
MQVSSGVETIQQISLAIVSNELVGINGHNRTEAMCETCSGTSQQHKHSRVSTEQSSLKQKSRLS